MSQIISICLCLWRY